MCVPSIRRCKFSGKPANGVRFEGIRCDDAYLDVIAFRALEQSVFETDWARRNAFQHHPSATARTAKALNCGQELLGRGHGTFPAIEAGALPNSLSPMVADGRAVMPLSWHTTKFPSLVKIAHISKVYDFTGFLRLPARWNLKSAKMFVLRFHLPFQRGRGGSWELRRLSEPLFSS
jgi:hypothetical protein